MIINLGFSSAHAVPLQSPEDSLNSSDEEQTPSRDLHVYVLGYEWTWFRAVITKSVRQLNG